MTGWAPPSNELVVVVVAEIRPLFTIIILEKYVTTNISYRSFLIIQCFNLEQPEPVAVVLPILIN